MADGDLTRLYDKIDGIAREVRDSFDSFKKDVNSEITKIQVKLGQMEVVQRPAHPCQVYVSEALEKQIKDKCESIDGRKMNKLNASSWTVLIVVLGAAIGAPFAWSSWQYNEAKEDIKEVKTIIKEHHPIVTSK